MDTMEMHVGNMETKLKHFGARLDHLAAKAGEAGCEAKSDYHRGLDDLKAKLQVAHAKLAELRTAGSASWQTFTVGVEAACEVIEDAFKKLPDHPAKQPSTKA